VPRPYQLDSYNGAAYVMMKWTLRQIFERVARGASTALRVGFADCTTWRAHQGEPDVTIVFRTSSAERQTVLLGYVGFFEACFDGDVASRRPVRPAALNAIVVQVESQLPRR
jgi:hypothetical protein